MSPDLEAVVSQRHRWTGELAWLLVAACTSLGRQGELVIVRWLQCVECDNGELQAVVDLGQAAVPRLRQYLLQGPDSAELSRVRAYLVRSHDSLVSYQTQRGTPLPLGQTLLLQVYLSNLDAVYRARAARALRGIGGADALDALHSASHLSLRPDVYGEIRAALDSFPP